MDNTIDFALVTFQISLFINENIKFLKSICLIIKTRNYLRFMYRAYISSALGLIAKAKQRKHIVRYVRIFFLPENQNRKYNAKSHTDSDIWALLLPCAPKNSWPNQIR